MIHVLKRCYSETACRKSKKKTAEQDTCTCSERTVSKGRPPGSGVTRTSRGMPRAGWSPQLPGEQGVAGGEVHSKLKLKTLTF